ncbi:MAG: apolipoprotein N-acyltransferase [Elusimicrobia bacterium]|nr:apolipoprotein N-acyltransferase [Elusimicrobiota bacterium]MBD3412589.1 apolipoprotein N-acyltransferase [Elusimicrobiota bacterium]
MLRTITHFFSNRWFPLIAVVLSGILLTVSFPKWNIYGAAWIWSVPLLLVLPADSFKRSLLLGFNAGLLGSLGIYYWIVVAVRAAGQPVIFAVLCLCMLSVYCALYIACFAGIMAWIKRFSPIMLWPILGAMTWVSLEFIRTFAFTGFPWMLLGYSQWNLPSIIQCCDITGVYGVSFMVMFVNITVFTVMSQPSCSIVKRIGMGIIGFLLVLIVFVYGMITGSVYRDTAPITHDGVLKVSLLQGNIDQYQKWDTQYESMIKEVYADLTMRASDEDPDLIIWPETAFPGFFEEFDKRQWLNRLVKASRTHHLVGAPSFRQKKYYNSLFLMNPFADVIGSYDKKRLVLFGEIIPFERFLSRWIRVLNELGGCTPGTKSQIIELDKKRLGVSICFEAIFPYHIRESVKHGAQVLINLTNDAWYLQSAAAYQHFIMNIFRAVETRRFLIRAANTGISAIIRPEGRIAKQTPLDDRTWITATVFLSDKRSWYVRLGDTFSYICLFISLLSMFYFARKYFLIKQSKYVTIS